MSKKSSLEKKSGRVEMAAFVIMATAAGFSGMAIAAAHVNRSQRRIRATGRYSAFFTGDKGVPPHIIAHVRIGNVQVPAMIDTGFGGRFTLTYDTVRAILQESEQEWNALPVEDKMKRIESTARDISDERIREFVQSRMNVTLLTSRVTRMTGLVATVEKTSTDGDGVVEMLHHDTGTHVSPDDSGVDMTLTDLAGMPCVLTMPYLRERAPVTIAVDGANALINFDAEPVGMTPIQTVSGGVCRVAVDIQCGARRSRVRLIVDTGFPGAVTLNRTVVDRLGASCSYQVSDAGVTQYDVFDQPTCSAVLTGTVSILSTVRTEPSIVFDDVHMLVTEGDMKFEDGLIGMGLLQSLVIGIAPGPHPLRLQDTGTRSGVQTNNQWAATSRCVGHKQPAPTCDTTSVADTADVSAS